MKGFRATRGGGLRRLQSPEGGEAAKKAAPFDSEHAHHTNTGGKRGKEEKDDEEAGTPEGDAAQGDAVSGAEDDAAAQEGVLR